MDIKTYKQKLLEEVYAPCARCIKCPLGTLGRNSIVFGEGNPNAKLMFLGEGPGQKEDEQARPFVGRSGQLLTRVIESLGAKREEIYITNIVKCRPPKNRKPSPKESKTCKELLLFKQIKIIRPKVICTLGSSALEALIEKPVSITKLRGKPISFKNTTVLPTFHPAYILRNRRELENFAADLKKAKDILKSDSN